MMQTTEPQAATSSWDGVFPALPGNWRWVIRDQDVVRLQRRRWGLWWTTVTTTPSKRAFDEIRTMSARAVWTDSDGNL